MINSFYKILLFFITLTLALTANAETFQSGITNDINIKQPAEVVYDYVTTADNWKDWHPNTRDTDGANDHPATLGEEITEYLKIGDFDAGTIHWVVTGDSRPTLWQITGEYADAPVQFTITYTLTTTRRGDTHYRRELVYTFEETSLNVLLNYFFIRPAMRFTSTQAVRHLKAEVEDLMIE